MVFISDVASYLESFFPRRAKDVPFLYHVPLQHPKLPSGREDVLHDGIKNSIDHSRSGFRDAADLTRLPCSRIILSITPTSGVYASMKQHAQYPPVTFLHRPFGLDRRNVRRGTVIVSSHVGFDEVLTVGFNVVLAERLGVMIAPELGIKIIDEIDPTLNAEGGVATMEAHPGNDHNSLVNFASDHQDVVCLKGYKGDPERRIGIMGELAQISTANHILNTIKQEFGKVEAVFGFGESDDYSMVLQQDKSIDLEPLLSVLSTINQQSAADDSVCSIAIMNAFHPTEVDRVLDAARKHNLVRGLEDRKNRVSPEMFSPSKILYLTGAPRLPGLVYALQQGMKVVCVGHRTCEEWGIRYLASELKRHFPHLHVEEIYEDEEPIPSRKTPKFAGDNGSKSGKTAITKENRPLSR